MRSRLAAAVAAPIAVAALAGLLALAAPRVAELVATPEPIGSGPPIGTVAPVGSPGPSPALDPAAVIVSTPGFWSWARLDRATLEILGGPWRTTDTLSTESMIKVWLVADRLRSYAEAGTEPPAEVLALASAAIRDSDDQAAETLFRDGGGDQVVDRLVGICGLTDTTGYPGYWSRTEMSARDAVRMGLCIADGRAAGPQWTAWVLTEMRLVRGGTAAADQPHGGRWGIIEALPPGPAGRLAIKNGWTAIVADGTWHVNCLAIADDWVLAVQAQYPTELGLEHGAGICREVARQVVADPA